jgi:hypothetical protein
MERQHFYQIPDLIEHHPYFQWYVDPRLRRYIYQRISADRSPSQRLEIAQILVAEVQKIPLAPRHYTLPERNLSGCITALIAHILFAQQKARLYNVVEMLQRHFQGTELRDVYQVSLVIISIPSKFLGNFQPQGDWYPSLCWYIHHKFQRSLTDELRRLAGDNFKRTNLGLLHRCSSMRLEISLRQLGEKGQYLDRSLLLHQCFQETVTAKQFITSNPQTIHYDALLARYRDRQPQTKLTIGDRDELQALLQNLSNIVRHDRQTTYYSLDAPLSQDHESGTVGDLVADPTEIFSMENHEMREVAIDLISTNLRSASSEDLIFLLLYGLDLTQVEAGRELDCNQSTIGRKHDRRLAKLATEFYLGYHNLLPTTQITIEILAANIKYIKSLCEDYYAELVINILTVMLDRPMLESSIFEQFVDRIETQWQFKFKPDGKGLSKVEAFVHQRSISRSQFP